MKVFEINGNTLSLTLFIDVTNSNSNQYEPLAGKLDPEVSFLNASLIPDVFPVLVAACKALSSVHSEFVYSYLVSKHITEKRGGVSDDSSYDLMLLVMRWYYIIYIHVLLVAIHYFCLRLYPAYSTLMLH
ncbi:hypothetical protein ERO13_D02G210201v2 [Gossypium hirsutum]|nr:hypothetical protein ERO13_D02G210201v2 [Gossypium hirsutum]